MNTQQEQFIHDSLIEGIHIMLIHINKKCHTLYLLQQISDSYYCITKDDIQVYASNDLYVIFAFLRGMIYVLD